MAHWKVLKFGGTSLARAAQWNAIAGLAEERLADGGRVVLVCSALAGVTNALQALADGSPDPGVRGIMDRHAALAHELGVDAAALLGEAENRIAAMYERYASDRHPADLAALLSAGEWLSSRLGAAFLSSFLDIEWVDARAALRVLPEQNPDSARAWLSARCAAGPDPKLARQWAREPRLLITQGFVASAPDGRTALLGRGGSDTSAALLASRLRADVIEIWTDVPGLFSADPRHEPRAVLIRRLDYAEALELAASGARVVHPNCIRAASEAEIPVRIRDLGQPQLEGTEISGGREESPECIKAVTRQDGMLVLLLENLDTRQQVGFLAWVFQAISDQGISVDLVATSETTTTVALNMAANHMDADAVRLLTTALGARCRVRVFDECSCVNLVGRGARTALARLGPAANLFAGRPLLMVSQSANDLSLSLLVHTADAAVASTTLHAIFLDGQDGAGSLFGPRWSCPGAEA